MNSIKKLSGKIAVITGASRSIGIGAAICRRLAAEGADIFFTYYYPYDELQEWGKQSEFHVVFEEELRQFGVRCASMAVDLSRANQAGVLFNEVEQAFGTPSILINNATYSVSDNFETLTAESLDKHYAVNVRGTLLLSVEFARRFDKSEGGRIISMSSGQSLGPMVGEISYASTKGAIEAFTKTFAAEVGHKGITVNALNPGPTDTGWMTNSLQQELAGHSPFGRVGLPEDAARTIAFLASDEAQWITGQVIHSDGGFR